MVRRTMQRSGGADSGTAHHADLGRPLPEELPLAGIPLTIYAGATGVGPDRRPSREVVMIVQIVVVVLVLAALGLAASVRVVKQYERGVVFRFGRLLGEPRGPGLTAIVPGVDRLQKVSLQIVTMPIPGQEGITKDNVTVRVDAVIYFNVVDPARAVVNVENYLYAMGQVAQTSLRSIIGKTDLDDLLSNREELNKGLEVMIDNPALGWGVHIDRVEIKDVSLPETMKRSIARQAEAERERRSRIISADGEYQASQKLSQAADVMSDTPSALQLRLLETVVEVSAEKNSTLVLPFPVELLQFFDVNKTRGEQRTSREAGADSGAAERAEGVQQAEEPQEAGEAQDTGEAQETAPSGSSAVAGPVGELDSGEDVAEPVPGGLTAIPPRPRLPEEDGNSARTPHGIA